MKINNYKYDETYIGLTESFYVKVTSELQESFLNLSGDFNPLHINDEFAKSKKFNGRLVYGMLLASFFSKLVGIYIPGKQCLLHSVDIKFLKPVYIGESIEVTGTVVEKNDIFKQLKIKGYIVNSQGDKVSKAIIKVGVLDE